jgi:hypothetical protein
MFSSRFEYYIFYVLHLFMAYLLTPPIIHSLLRKCASLCSLKRLIRTSSVCLMMGTLHVVSSSVRPCKTLQT